MRTQKRPNDHQLSDVPGLPSEPADRAVNGHGGSAPGKPNGTPEAAPTEKTLEDSWWSASRAQIKADQKGLMAQYFARHHFLVREGELPEAPRETVATIAVNQGTTPNRVVAECLKWVSEHRKPGEAFFLTWYTPGHVIPTTLRSFKNEHWPMRTAAKLFLFPGEVDDETESVSGPDAEEYAEHVRHRFTYALLSGYSFDMSTGDVYFYLPHEVRLQKACAKMFAAHKFLFFDTSKLKREGEVGYNVSDLLATADTVTIYTVSSTPEKDDWVKSKFKSLCTRILKPPSNPEQDIKTLRLQIVGAAEGQSSCVADKGVIASRE